MWKFLRCFGQVFLSAHDACVSMFFFGIVSFLDSVSCSWHDMMFDSRWKRCNHFGVIFQCFFPHTESSTPFRYFLGILGTTLKTVLAATKSMEISTCGNPPWEFPEETDTISPKGWGRCFSSQKTPWEDFCSFFLCWRSKAPLLWGMCFFWSQSCEKFWSDQATDGIRLIHKGHEC